MTRIASLTHTDIARHAARGRLLQGRAVRFGFAATFRWLFGAAVGAVARRSFARRSPARRSLAGTGCGAHA